MPVDPLVDELWPQLGALTRHLEDLNGQVFTAEIRGTDDRTVTTPDDVNEAQRKYNRRNGL